jgi:hypothetical protein
MSDNLPARLERIEDRLLMLEAGHKAPLSFADLAIAKQLHQERMRPHDAARRRLDALREAQVEAERLGTDKPIDDLVRRLKRGEFDLPLRPE